MQYVAATVTQNHVRGDDKSKKLYPYPEKVSCVRLSVRDPSLQEVPNNSSFCTRLYNYCYKLSLHCPALHSYFKVHDYQK